MIICVRKLDKRKNEGFVQIVSLKENHPLNVYTTIVFFGVNWFGVYVINN